MEDDVASARFNKLEAEQEIERLKGQIVTSPDRVKGELKVIAENLDRAKEDLRELEEKQDSVLAFIGVYERAEKELARTLALLNEIEQEMKACKEAKHQVKNTIKRINELQYRTAETITRRQRLEKVVELKKRELERYIAESRMKEEGASNALRSAREELSKLESVHYEARQRITQNTDASRKVELKMKEDEAQFQKELKDLEQVSHPGLRDPEVIGTSQRKTRKAVHPDITLAAYPTKRQQSFIPPALESDDTTVLISRTFDNITLTCAGVVRRGLTLLGRGWRPLLNSPKCAANPANKQESSPYWQGPGRRLGRVRREAGAPTRKPRQPGGLGATSCFAADTNAHHSVPSARYFDFLYVMAGVADCVATHHAVVAPGVQQLDGAEVFAAALADLRRPLVGPLGLRHERCGVELSPTKVRNDSAEHGPELWHVIPSRQPRREPACFDAYDVRHLR
ncbi:hypothetical protein ON010_g12577 [Phytophthora cinnamomi]|nr:hypothetical protein ON010_g12577 [Phytophthora cinnamomi]